MVGISRSARGINDRKNILLLTREADAKHDGLVRSSFIPPRESEWPTRDPLPASHCVLGVLVLSAPKTRWPARPSGGKPASD